jgi:hypothetical protein
VEHPYQDGVSNRPLIITRNPKHSATTFQTIAIEGGHVVLVREEVQAVAVTLMRGVDGVNSPEGGMSFRQGMGEGPVDGRGQGALWNTSQS